MIMIKKVGIFRMIKDIKDKAINIDNDDEAIREIRVRIKELIKRMEQRLIILMK